ncbi:gamma-1-syntrophin [Cricetulus griseus]|uniref:Gamma-1-syntrophin n=1 Tax=Cricetulus griseus TaxID=10029 RepID=A0A061IDT5_CRIGR|nr:gamma-1-syntrophin [Cricetulus griseus]
MALKEADLAGVESIDSSGVILVFLLSVFLFCLLLISSFSGFRQNAFQVVAVDGVCSGIIQCLSAEDCMDWLQALAANISNLTKHNEGFKFLVSKVGPLV